MSGDLAMAFVGVSTGQSSIRRVYPAWARILGLPTERLVGHDVPLGARDEEYRELVKWLRDDETCAGALVTTHKVGVYQAAADLFDDLDTFASLCGEISSVSKRDGRLVGHAKDPLTVGLSLEEIVPQNHFAGTGGHVLCLGTGGAGIALAWYLAQRADRPERIVCTARRTKRLDDLRGVMRRGGLDAGRICPELVDGPADRLLKGLPPHSLVVNATGLGKDRPGSPLGDGAAFPERGIAWDFNYRGSLEFLHQARAQQVERSLTVVDGWRYFVHGWSQVIAEVFDLSLTPAQVEDLAVAAEEVR
ncbi:MAG: shikimate dehydrogenase [Streptosporangiales bacterium]|nr:shikimate dehydrogenase [Streptosporangiales bacterium]